MKDNDFFIKVTNEQIYDEIINIKICIEKLKHKVSIACWTGATALTIALITIILRSL